MFQRFRLLYKQGFSWHYILFNQTDQALYRATRWLVAIASFLYTCASIIGSDAIGAVIGMIVLIVAVVMELNNA